MCSIAHLSGPQQFDAEVIDSLFVRLQISRPFSVRDGVDNGPPQADLRGGAVVRIPRKLRETNGPNRDPCRRELVQFGGEAECENAHRRRTAESPRPVPDCAEGRSRDPARAALKLPRRHQFHQVLLRRGHFFGNKRLEAVAPQRIIGSLRAGSAHERGTARLIGR